MTDQFPQKDTIEEELAQLAKQIPALPTDYADLRRLLALLPPPMGSENPSPDMGNPALNSIGAAQPSQSSSPLLGPAPGTTPAASIALTGVITHGWQPSATMQGLDVTDVLTTAHNLAADGGMLVLPVEITAPMMLERVSVWNTDTASERAWNWALYEQTLSVSTSKTLTRIAAGMAPDTFTPGAASKRAVPYFAVSGTSRSGRTSPKFAVISSDSAYAYVTAFNYVSVIRTSDWLTIRQAYSGGATMYTDLAITPDGAYIYVMDSQTTGHVYVFRTSDLSIVATINLTSVSSSGIEMAPNGAFVYVRTGAYPNGLTKVIRTSDNTVIQTIDHGGIWTNYKTVFSPDSAYAYVSLDSGYIKKYRTSDHTEVGSLYWAGIATQARDFVLTPDGAYIYATYGVTNFIKVIRTSDMTVYASPSIGSVNPYITYLTVTPDGQYVYLSCSQLGQVMVIRTSDNTLIKTVTVQSYPGDIQATPDSNFVYVVNRDSDSVSIIRVSDNVVLATILAGYDPRNMIISPDGLKIFCLNSYGAIPYTSFHPVFAIMVSPGLYWLAIHSVHDTNTFGLGSAASGTLVHNTSQSKTIRVPNKVEGLAAKASYTGNIAINPAGTYVYCTDYAVGTGKCYVFRTSDNTIVASPSVGSRPDELCVTADGAYIYVVNAISQTISVIRSSDHTVLTTISGMTNPGWLSQSPDGTFLYVGNVNSSNGYVYRIRISDNTITATVTTGIAPGNFPPIFKADSTYAYVATWAGIEKIRTSDNTVVSVVDYPGTSMNVYGLAGTPDGRYIYMTVGTSVYCYETATDTFIATIVPAGSPDEIISAPNSAYIYVLSNSMSTLAVYRVSDNFLISTIQMAGNPEGFVATPDGQFIAVASYYADNVYIIRTNDFTAIAQIGSSAYYYPWRICVSPDSKMVYVAGDEGTVGIYAISVGDLTQVDFVAATWAKHTGVYAAVMEGRVFGQTAVF